MQQRGDRLAGDWQRVDLLAVVALGLLLALLYLATAQDGPAQVNDTRAASVAAWSLGTQGSLALPEPWPASRNYWGAEGRDGRVLVNRFPGVAYWAAPAYAAVSLVDDTPAPAHPFLVDPWPAAVAAALTGAGVAVALFVLLRRLVARRAAVVATLVVATGTSLWSVAADAMWPHGPGMLALAALLLGWRGGRPVIAAAAAAVAVLVRPHLVVVVMALAVFARLREQRPRDAGWLAAGGAAGLLALSAYTAWAFGTPLPVAGYDAGGHLGGLVTHSPWQTVRELALALASPSRGLFVYSPVVLAGVVAAVTAWRTLPPWTVASAAAGLLYLLVQVRALGAAGGTDFFAYRVSLEPLLLAAPALAVGTTEAVRHRRWPLVAVALLAAASVVVHAHGAIAGGISGQTAREWERIDATVREEFGDARLHEVDLR